jgi:hypothetical protein
LLLENTTFHDQKRYVLAGPGDITGRSKSDLVEKHADTKVHDVASNDRSGAEVALKSAGTAENALKTIVDYMDSAGDEMGSRALPTSPEVFKLYEIKNRLRTSGTSK